MNSFVSFFLKVRNSNIFSGIVIAVILASAIYAGVISYEISPKYTIYLDLFDYAITVFFVIEIIIRMISERSLIKFFKDGWNIFDSTIVLISLIPIPNNSSFLLLRLLRVFRVLRIISVIPELKKIIEALLGSIKRVFYVGLLLFIIFTFLIPSQIL